VPEDYFDDWIAERCERLWPEVFDPAVVEPAVEFLAELANGGAVLEFGIGTGRLALPLSRRGLRVSGIDLSPAMIAQLQAQPGGEAIEVAIGDFAIAKVGGTFRLAYLVATQS
jgi:2-polyprenyl-3-methyl-5-hydroxy-6-metoxy-1,4-benzoquinol methylase